MSKKKKLTENQLKNIQNYGCFMGYCKKIDECLDCEAKKGLWGDCHEFEEEN